jgi:hypothetical protein
MESERVKRKYIEPSTLSSNNATSYLGRNHDRAYPCTYDDEMGKEKDIHCI